MSALISKSKLLFFIFLILSFLFLFNFPGMSKNQQPSGIISHHLDWTQSLNKDIPALANRSNSLRVADLFQQGNLLAVKLSGFQDDQGNERKIEKIMVIDLSTHQILYEKVFYDSKTFIGLYENYLIYSYKENDKKSADDYKLKIIDLTNENREREFKGTLDRITENGYILCHFPGHIIDIEKNEIVFSHEYLKSSSSLMTSSGFFMKDKDEQGNWDRYQFTNFQGEVIFSLPDINKTYLPRNEANSILSFPIPILKAGENEENMIQFIDASGEVVDTYPLSEMGIPGTAFGQNQFPYGHLEILANYEQKYILEVEVSTQEEKGKEYIIWLDIQQNQAFILEEDIRVMADFHATGHLMMLVESESGYGHFTLKYYDPQGNCLWEKYLPPDIDGWVELYPINEENFLLYDNHSTFFRYSLTDGQLDGLYPFPIDYNVQPAALFDNQTYVLIGQGRNDTELEGNHLVSFSLENNGWFDFELVKVSPLAGQPLTVYEDREIELEFQGGQYNLAEEQLEITCGKGEVLDQSGRYGGRWDCQWQSPELIDKEQETVNITATYGPISKNYQVVVKNLKNPLILTGELKVDSRDQYQLILEGNIKNTAYMDIKDLDWQWELDNLNEIHSSFPKNIPAQRERPFSMRLNRLAISEEEWEKIDWNGYQIAQQIKLRCDYPEGKAEKIFEHALNIQPEYFITLKLYDPKTKKYWGRKSLEYLDLSRFEVMNEKGDIISTSLQISKSMSKNLVKLGGLASGIKKKPVKIGVSYNGEVQWYGLEFQSEEHPRFPELVEDSFQFNLAVDSSYRILTDNEVLDQLPDADGDFIPFPGNRGACGAGMPSTATNWPDKAIKVLDPNHPEYFYLVVYKGIQRAGTHIGCRFHDACFDICKNKKGEDYAGAEYKGPCHDLCSLTVLKLFPAENGASWMIGGGPYEGYLLFYQDRQVLGPFKSDITKNDLINRGTIKPNTELCENQTCPNMALYAIEIWTGDKWGAGTDAQVYIKLGNDVGMHCRETSEIALLGAPFTNKSAIDEIANEILSQSLSLSGFERNNHETYYFIRAECLPEINFIRLRRNDSGSFPDWYCKKIKIYREKWNTFEKEEELTEISVNQWIGTKSKKFDSQ